MEKIVAIEGMRCGGCTARVEKAIKALGAQVKVDLAAKTAVINGELTDDEIRDAIEDLGFEVKDIH